MHAEETCAQLSLVFPAGTISIQGLHLFMAGTSAEACIAVHAI